ncbi:MAG: hypothetical protein HPY52_03115 [Firmicutes bacterium]|nr:hypothetical protein [Bacillota bacterium]
MTITGGIVEVPSYALVNVALPGDIAARFSLPEFATLAFDYDVAKETPGAEFVTFGSPALDKFISLGSEVGRVIRESAMVSAIRVPQNLMGRIESKVGFNRCRRPTLKTTTIQAYERVVFRFIVSYISDEKFSDSIAIAIDASTLADDTDLLDESRTVFWSDDLDMLSGSAGSRPMAQVAHKGGDGGEAPYVRDASGRARNPVSSDGATSTADRANGADSANRAGSANRAPYPGIPLAERRPYKEVLDAALARLQEMSRARLATYQVEVSGFCQRELVKVLGFYEKTLEDLKARAETAGDPEKKSRIEAKIQATQLDRQRRISDVIGKYKMTAEARLDSVTIQVMPKVKAILEVQHKDSVYTQEVFYNLATNSVEPLTCPKCGRRFFSAYPTKDGSFVCRAEEAE